MTVETLLGTGIGLSLLLTLILLSTVIVDIVRMIKDPNFHSWPAVTRCRICDKRVFVWQRRERRAFNVSLDNPDKIATLVGASGIVHKKCKGNPEFKCSVHIGCK